MTKKFLNKLLPTKKKDAKATFVMVKNVSCPRKMPSPSPLNVGLVFGEEVESGGGSKCDK